MAETKDDGKEEELQQEIIVVDESARCRSVNDFDTKEGLRAALKDMGTKRVAFFTNLLPTSSSDLMMTTTNNNNNNIPKPKDDNDSTSHAGGSISMSDDYSMSNSHLENQQQLDWVLTNYDTKTTRPPTLDDELNRLRVLRSYLILDAERESSFERITGLAQRIFDVPICLVSLVDLGRQWFMSNRGLDSGVRETPRKLAFCAHCIASTQDLLIVPDATQDERFKQNPLVTTAPHIRFYAGAPLKCPEGYALGTLCLIDTKTHPDGLTLDEKQNLRELADLVMDAMVDRRKVLTKPQQDSSHLIACTAHDLLTPLNGVQLSLSLLSMDDDDMMKNVLNETQKELLTTASHCSEMMARLCHSAIDTFRGTVQEAHHKEEQQRSTAPDISTSTSNEESSSCPAAGPRMIVIADLVKNLQMVMQPYPKSVPLFFSIDIHVPPCIVSDDLKIFRSVLNFLTNACRKTQTGSVHLKIFVQHQETGNNHKTQPMLVFDCEDTGPGVPVEYYQHLFRPYYPEVTNEYNDAAACIKLDPQTGQMKSGLCRAHMSHSGLGLYSVANNVTSLGGDYGFRPRNQNADGTEAVVQENGGGNHHHHNGKPKTGAIFWFSIPLKLPSNNETNGDAKIKNVKINQIKSETVKEPPKPLQIETTAARSPATAEESTKRVRVLSTTNLNETESSQVYDAVNKVFDAIAAPPAQPRVRQALVIDDSLVIRKSVSRALSKLGFQVSHAVNGMEGLKLLQSSVYDVVLCDFLMPVMDGLDCVQQYRSWEETHRPWFRQYIVGISAHANGKDAERGLSAGMNDFKPKPITFKTLKELETSDALSKVKEHLDEVHLKNTNGSSKQTSPRQAASANDAEVAHADKKAKQSRDNSPSSRNAFTAKVHRDHTGPVCLIADDSVSTCKCMSRAINELGWKTSMVHDGEDTLRLLKMRKWDAVFLDDEMPRLTGTRCIERFREWERHNRVSRQRNVFLVSGNYIPTPTEGSSVVYPTGFDGALGKPFLMKDLKELIDVSAQNLGKHDILVR